MDYNEAAKMLVEKGFYYSNLDGLPSAAIKETMRQFMHRKTDDRIQFLQKEINSVFDGYSYQGQTDSLNQGAEDLVHTFVISEFTDPTSFPLEWQHYLSQAFFQLSNKLSILETVLIEKLALHINRKDLGHMVSCNYYPSTNDSKALLRLGAHPDVSLFTVFPFGIDDQLEFEENGIWEPLPASDKMVIITGYFSEVLSNGRVSALNHRVRQSQPNSSERFSFAFFSIPAPNRKFSTEQGAVSTEKYFEKYLALF
jgi:hypothetical protein